jgi:hypothetical protein
MTSFVKKKFMLLFGPVKSTGIHHWIHTKLLNDTGPTIKVTYC